MYCLIDARLLIPANLVQMKNCSPKREYKIVRVKFEFNEIVSYHRTRLQHNQLNTKYSSRLRAIQNYDTLIYLSNLNPRDYSRIHNGDSNPNPRDNSRFHT